MGLIQKAGLTVQTTVKVVMALLTDNLARITAPKPLQVI